MLAEVVGCILGKRFEGVEGGVPRIQPGGERAVTLREWD
jgi:hypothetical protein